MATRIEKREISSHLRGYASLLLGISFVSILALPAAAQFAPADEPTGTPIVSDEKRPTTETPAELSYEEAMKAAIDTANHTKAAEKWTRRTVTVPAGQDPKRVIESEMVQTPALLGIDRTTLDPSKVEPIKIDKPISQLQKVNLDGNAAPDEVSNDNGGWDWVGKDQRTEVQTAAETQEGAPVPQKTAGFTTVFDATSGATPQARPASNAAARQTLASDVESGAPTPQEEEQTSEPAQAAATEEEEQEGPPKTAAEVAKEAVAIYNGAVKLHLAGKLDEAITEYRAALAANPELSQAHCNLGLIFNQQHDYAKAIVEFRKALALEPRDAITYNGIGAALRAQKDIEGAIKNWQTAVQLDPKLATAHYNLGTVYEIQKDYDKALQTYELAIKNDYRLGEAHYRLGLILMKKNRVADAKEQFSQALQVSKNAEYCEDARKRLAAIEQAPTR